MRPKTPSPANLGQVNFIWQFIVIALLMIIGAAVLVQNWQLNLAVSFLGMTSVGLPLSGLMAIAFGAGLIVAWTIALVNAWANGANGNSTRLGAKTARRWGNGGTDDFDVPPTKPQSPQSKYPNNQAVNQPPTQVAERPVDQDKAATPNPSPSPRVSMRDSQSVPPKTPKTNTVPQPVPEKRPPSQGSAWSDDEWEAEDEWEEEYEDDWEDDAPDDEPDDPDTVPYGGKRSSGKSAKDKRPPLQARYIRW